MQRMNESITAFPVPQESKTVGLSTREYFAAAALTGIMAAAQAPTHAVGALAVQVADDTIAELKRTDPLNNPPFTNKPAV